MSWTCRHREQLRKKKREIDKEYEMSGFENGSGVLAEEKLMLSFSNVSSFFFFFFFFLMEIHVRNIHGVVNHQVQSNWKGPWSHRQRESLWTVSQGLQGLLRLQ